MSPLSAAASLLVAGVAGALNCVAAQDAPAASAATTGGTILSDRAKYATYYRHTCKAEEHLLAGEPAAALAEYEVAFAGAEFRFARDACIAAQVAASLGHERTEALVEACVLGGVPLGFACSHRPFASFRDGEAYRRLAAREAELLARYEARIDRELKAEVERRYHLEQRAKSGNREAYFAVVDDNVAWLARQLEKGGFPGEMRIGIDRITTSDGPRPHVPRCSFAATQVAPTLKHFPYAFDLLKEPLLRAMGDGQIDPRELATVFVFAKHRVCIWRPGTPAGIEQRIEDSTLRDVVFRVAFEKQPVAIDVANRHRADWLLPRLGGRYDVAGLRRATGVDLSVGNCFD